MGGREGEERGGREEGREGGRRGRVGERGKIVREGG
jgi:hypothetical protein